MSERIYRIVFHTTEERKNFEKVKAIVETIIPPEMMRVFEPNDNGKKVIFFAATNPEKNKVEKELKNKEIKVTISSPLAPC